jgi:preprotein translocase subunit YajC
MRSSKKNIIFPIISVFLVIVLVLAVIVYFTLIRPVQIAQAKTVKLRQLATQTFTDAKTQNTHF